MIAEAAKASLAASKMLLEFEVAFYLLGKDIFLSFSLQPLGSSAEGSSLSVQATQTDSWRIAVPQHKVPYVLGVPVWVSLKIAIEYRLFKMTDVLGVFLSAPPLPTCLK